jgi:hypothetical protein
MSGGGPFEKAMIMTGQGKAAANKDFPKIQGFPDYEMIILA